MITECQVHGCTAKPVADVLVYPGRRPEEIPVGHGNVSMKARVCKDHKTLYDQQGFLGGLHVPDDPDAYREQITLKPEEG